MYNIYIYITLLRGTKASRKCETWHGLSRIIERQRMN